MKLANLRDFFLKEKKQIITVGIFLTLAAIVLAANSFSKGGLLKGALGGNGPVVTPIPINNSILINGSVVPVMNCQYTPGVTPSITWNWIVPDATTTDAGAYYLPKYYTLKDTPNGSNTVGGASTSSTKIESGTTSTRYYPAGTTQVKATIDVYGCMVFEQTPGAGLTCKSFPIVATKTCTAPIVAKPTVTTLALSGQNNDGIFPGTPLQVVATVNITGGVQNEFPNGTVTFKEGNTVIGSSAIGLNTNQATIQTSFQTTGTHLITASYAGTAKYNASVTANPLEVTIAPKIIASDPPPVQKTATSITFTTSAPNGSPEGSQISFEAILLGAQAIPTGNVVITDGVGGPVLFSKNLVTADNSTINFSTAALTQGSHNIHLTYAGDTTNLSAEKNITQIVNTVVAQNNLTISCSANPANPKTGDPVTWSASITGATDPTQINYEWAGDFEKVGTFNASGKMSGTTQYNSAGTKSAEITVYNEPSPPLTKNCSVNVINSNPIDKVQVPPAAKTQTPDILSCQNYGSKTLALSAHEQIYSSCSLSQAALVSAYILKDSYKSGAEIKPDDIVRTIMDPQSYQPQKFSVGWNGQDDYDSNVDLGQYKIVVGAQFPGNTIPDYSILDIQVIQDPVIVPKDQTPPDKTVTVVPPVKTKINDLFNPKNFPLVNNNLHSAAKEMSKCAGVYYPTDIETHWARDYIRYIIDKCVIQGFSDGTFKPDLTVTRAQAVKIVLGAAGIQPETNCPNSSCGTGFKDLQPWEGPWIRAGQKYGLINGKGHTQFFPEAPIKREQYTVFSEQAMKIRPHAGCYTTNCGAGAPDNVFNDIVHAAAGAYLRTLTDLKIISGVGPNEFGVNQPLSRGEAAKIIAKIMALREQSLLKK